MRRLASLFLTAFSAVAAPAAPPAPESPKPPLPPYVVRVLALGHEPNRKYKAVAGGLFVMVPPEPDEVPPATLYLKPPPSSTPLPPGSPLARQFNRVPCELTLNGIQQSTVPAEIPRDAKLVIEREAAVQPEANGAAPVTKVYDELGVLERKPDSTSALVILYNPAGSRTWNNVKANVIDTSEPSLPVGSILVYNLCREKLFAAIGSGSVGTLDAGQSAFVHPQVDADGNFSLRLALDREGEQVQLVDSARPLPAGSRAFLVVYPLPPNRNARNADFVLYVIPPDPKPEPVAVPGSGPKPGAKTAAR